MTDAIIRAFCKEQRELLALELESEQEESAFSSSSKEKNKKKNNAGGGGDDDHADQQRSHVLHQLEVADVSVGLYGRTVVRLTSLVTRPDAAAAAAGSGKGSSDALLPAHRFTTGDEVEIRSKSSESKDSPGGVVCQVTESSLSVALFSSNKNGKSDAVDSDSIMGMAPPLSLLPKSSIQVHQKYLAALEELERHGTSHPVAGRVVHTLMEVLPQAPPPQSASGVISTHLDASQCDAISFCLSENRPVSLIHGPPGTGKGLLICTILC